MTRTCTRTVSPGLSCGSFLRSAASTASIGLHGPFSVPICEVLRPFCPAPRSRRPVLVLDLAQERSSSARQARPPPAGRAAARASRAAPPCAASAARAPWSPESSTSGTAWPRHDGGPRVVRPVEQPSLERVALRRALVAEGARAGAAPSPRSRPAPPSRPRSARSRPRLSSSVASASADALVDPLVAAAQQHQPLEAARSAARSPGRSAGRAGESSTTRVPLAAASRAGSTRARGRTAPAFITMPGPPPNGASSTVRWRSSVKSRRSWTRRSDEARLARARCTMPSESGRLDHAREDRDHVNPQRAYSGRTATMRPALRGRPTSRSASAKGSSVSPCSGPARRAPAPRPRSPGCPPPCPSARARLVHHPRAPRAGGGSRSPRAATASSSSAMRSSRPRSAPRRRSSRRPRASARSGPCGASAPSTRTSRGSPPGPGTNARRSVGKRSGRSEKARDGHLPVAALRLHHAADEHEVARRRPSVEDLQRRRSRPGARRAPRAASAARRPCAPRGRSPGRGRRGRPRARSTLRPSLVRARARARVPGSRTRPAGEEGDEVASPLRPAAPRLALEQAAHRVARPWRPCRSSTSRARRRS